MRACLKTKRFVLWEEPTACLPKRSHAIGVGSFIIPTTYGGVHLLEFRSTLGYRFLIKALLV